MGLFQTFDTIIQIIRLADNWVFKTFDCYHAAINPFAETVFWKNDPLGRDLQNGVLDNIFYFVFYLKQYIY